MTLCAPIERPLTDEDIAIERKRLHDLMEKLVVWENSNNQKLLAEAHREI